MKETIYPSLEAADKTLSKCPRPHAGSGGYHWWYIDSKKLESSGDDVVPCICKTCSQTMLLSADADEYPAC